MAITRWQRFTEGARHAYFLAQEEATRLEHGYVGPEHLFLGLTRQISCHNTVFAYVLKNLGINIDSLKEEMETGIPDPPIRGKPVGDMSLTRTATRVLDFAEDEARLLGNDYIGTEHLLLGLIRESTNLAARLLQKHGLDRGTIFQEVQRVQAAQSLKIPPLDCEALANFLVWRVETHGWASNRDQRLPNGTYLKTSKSEDGWLAYDCVHLGDHRFTGFLECLQDEKTVWVMTYSGHLPEVADEKLVDDILDILFNKLRPSSRDPYRGADRSKFGDYEYSVITHGDLTHFTGDEFIHIGGKTVYRGFFYGEEVKKR